jgi:hypothetical protein
MSQALVSVKLLMTPTSYLAPTATTLRNAWVFHGF